MAATAPVTVNDALEYLLGLEPWLDAAAQSRQHYDAAAMVGDIQPAIRAFERRSQMRVNPVQVVGESSALTDYTTTGMETLVEGRYPYYRQLGGEQYMLTTLNYRPVSSVQRVRMFLGTSNIYSMPTEWIRFDAKSGRVWILPYSTASLLAAYSGWFAIIMSTQNRELVPDCISVDYVAGISSDWASDQNSREWADLKDTVAKAVALRILNKISYMFDAGVMSKNVGADGASTSLQYDRFQSRKAELEADVNGMQQLMVDQETGIPMVGL